MNSKEEIVSIKSISKWTCLKVVFKPPMLITLLLIIILGSNLEPGSAVNTFFYLFLGFYVFMILMSLALVGNKEVVVTNQRIIFKRKNSGKNIRYVPIRHVAAVSVRRGVLGSIFGFGDLQIDTSGNVRFEPINGVKHPDIIGESINEHASRY